MTQIKTTIQARIHTHNILKKIEQIEIYLDSKEAQDKNLFSMVSLLEGVERRLSRWIMTK